MSSKSVRGFADSVTRRLEALEKNIMPVDDSNKAALDELLDGLAAGTAPTTPKPKKDKAAADPELEKLLEAYAKYKMQSQNKDEKEEIEEIIL
jgi:hypothetical protein